jgi:hypothetical protein
VVCIDAQTGLFLSRDAVDVQQQGVEAFNPYQFAFGNPLVYSDPSGLTTITELNTAQIIDDILRAIESEVKQNISQQIKDKVQGISSRIIGRLIQNIVPFNFDLYPSGDGKKGDGIKGSILDNLFRSAVCNVIGSSFSAFLSSLWIEAEIDANGNPVANGYNCGSVAPYSVGKTPNIVDAPSISRPDFLFRNVPPLDTSNNPQGYLIGDLKYNVDSIKPDTDKQLNAILSYAKLKGVGKGSISKASKAAGGHQYVPFAMYVTVQAPSETKENKIKERALKYGVIFEVISLLPAKNKVK